MELQAAKGGGDAARARIAELEAALTEEVGRTEALNRIAEAIGSGRDLEAVVQAVVDGGVELTGARFGAFFYNVVDHTGESYTLYVISGVPRASFEMFPMPRNTRIFAPTFRGEGVVRSADITKDPRYGHNRPYRGMPKGHLPVTSYLAVPVKSRAGEVMGGLFFGHPDAGVFHDRHETLLGGLAGQAAAAIETMRLHEGSLRELEERRRAQQRQRLLLNELNHRVKNTLATVQSIAFQTLRTARSPSHFRDSFESRLLALSQTHNLLTEQGWERASLTQIVTAELEPYGMEAGRVCITGCDVPLNANAAVALGMAIHELVTNAAKYGALATPRGAISIDCRMEDADSRILRLTWRETGGPSVSIPQQRGFGSRLLEQGLARELSGQVRLDYDEAGLRCTMLLPLSSLEPAE